MLLPVESSPDHRPHLGHRVDLIHLGRYGGMFSPSFHILGFIKWHLIVVCVYLCVCVCASHLELCELLHELFLLLAVAEGREDVEEDLEVF